MRFNYQSPKTLTHDAIWGKMQAYFSHQAVGVSGQNYLHPNTDFFCLDSVLYVQLEFELVNGINYLSLMNLTSTLLEHSHV